MYDRIDIGPYDIGVGPDEKDSTANVLGLSQAGIGLPSRDYYGVGEEPDNDRFKQVRAGYVKFMNQSFAMAGVTANPDDVLKFETELAKIMWSQTQMRDPHATYFPTTIGNFSKVCVCFHRFDNLVDHKLLLSIISRGMVSLQKFVKHFQLSTIPRN